VNFGSTGDWERDELASLEQCPFRPEMRGTEWPLQKRPSRLEDGFVEAARFLGGQPFVLPGISQPAFSRTRSLPSTPPFYYNAPRGPAENPFPNTRWSGHDATIPIRFFLGDFVSSLRATFDQAPALVLKLVPHARAGDETLRFV